MFRLPLLIVCFLFLVGTSYAQGNLNGRIYENKTRIALSGISIQNLRSNVITTSDQNGLFSIKAHIGDLITFSSFAYRPDTLYVKDFSDVEILLDLRQNSLNEVRVVGSEIHLGNLKSPPKLTPFGGNTVLYQTDEKGNYKGGLAARLFDSHSAEKKRQKEVQLEKDEQIHNQINEAFSSKNLDNYIPIKGQELENFIILYRPNIETFTSGDFNMTIYIDNCYKEFLKIPLEKRKSKDYTRLDKKTE